LEDKLSILDGRFFGAQDKHGNEVGIDRLMENTFIEFAVDKLAIYIPGDEILRRTKYEWFARLSQQQLRQCDTLVAKQLLIAQG